MSRKIEVYGWQGFREGKCTREILAASSKAAVLRVAGVKYERHLFNLCKTGNTEEIAMALSTPGAIFWCFLDEPASRRKWTRT